MIGFENVDAFAQEYVIRVLDQKGVCVWKHSARYQDCMKDDTRYLEAFANKDYKLEVETPDEPKKILELTSQTLSNGLFA